ncbi:Bax inhibitor-1/YccA family protein [Flavihumibacter profundi]|uniref:Bax inhibitor-1/YccA family protein n=1 Tax=Flavihumibacter profundi TaxID=2716883 RepID=UPI001CC49386|nr:Bax inhibitor-1/YccA family protein [Flavihumibacter profundi]MBZ5857215.1 Bax inhibitor-1/YccA family protein [Flavihumibacter profundi]
MALFKSGNPTLSESKFEQSLTGDRSELMTSSGTLNKFFFLFFMVMASAVFTWNAFNQGVNVFPWMIGAAIGGLILALVLSFKPHLGSYLAPPYGLMQGVFVGGISAIYNDAFAGVAPGIVMQAVVLTFGTVIAMFVLYRTGIIKATERFKSIVFTATAGIAIFYLIAMVLRLFSIDIAFLHEGSMIGILFSVFVVAIAALNLILDFDRIEQGVAMGAPKYMEWYGAFGLIVTIVWLYIEILRLLSKLSSRK